MPIELPIMPLNSVLFPGMPMPLVIFEERYLEMIRICQEGDSTFGVALIREGQEVGGPAVPYDVETTAAIVSVESLDSDALQVMAIGQQRFRLQGLIQHEPYLIGEVELLDEEADAGAPTELHGELREAFGDYLRLILQLLGQPETELAVPESPARLSYMVAAHLTSPPVVRQRLLEMNSLAERLFHERVLLERQSTDYRLILSARQKQDELALPVGERDEEDAFSLN
jgi:uncharacterized protein